MKWLKRILCKHRWYYINNSISEVKCGKCSKEDIFFPW